MKYSLTVFISFIIFLGCFHSHAMESRLGKMAMHVYENKVPYAIFLVAAAGITYASAASPSPDDAYCPATLDSCWSSQENPLIDVNYFRGGYNIYEVVSGCVHDVCVVGAEMSNRLAHYVSQSCKFLGGERNFFLKLVRQEGSRCDYEYFYDNHSIQESTKMGKFTFEVYGPGPR
jgi:hypothetical protein